MTDLTKGLPPTMECVVIGGCADGSYLRNVRSDAGSIRLARPKRIKPLTSSTQKALEVETEHDVYDVHLFDIPGAVVGNPEQRARRIIGVAVVEGKTMEWAFKQLVLSYLEKSVREMQEQTRKEALRTTH